MTYIFVIRHGPVYYDSTGTELLDVLSFKKILPKILSYISKYSRINKIYTSPVSRCELTGNMIAKHYNHCDLKTKVELLRRPRGSPEPYCCAHERGYNFGKKIRKNMISSYETRTNKSNIMIVTHSSMYQSVVEGVIGHKLNEHGDIYINDTAITVYNVLKRKIEDFNIQMYCSSCDDC